MSVLLLATSGWLEDSCRDTMQIISAPSLHTRGRQTRPHLLQELLLMVDRGRRVVCYWWWLHHVVVWGSQLRCHIRQGAPQSRVVHGSSTDYLQQFL